MSQTDRYTFFRVSFIFSFIFSLLTSCRSMEVSRTSQEFAQLEYKLKTLLRSTTLHVRRCCQLSDHTRAYNFERNCQVRLSSPPSFVFLTLLPDTHCSVGQDILSIESWMNAAEVFDATQVEEIQRTLQVTNLKSVLFSAGKPDLSGLVGGEYGFVLFKVAIGRSLYVDGVVDRVPDGFDSVCVEGEISLPHPHPQSCPMPS